MDELKKLHDELNQLKWIGSDEGWDLAILAVQKRILELVNKYDGTYDALVQEQ